MFNSQQVTRIALEIVSQLLVVLYFFVFVETTNQTTLDCEESPAFLQN